MLLLPHNQDPHMFIRSGMGCGGCWFGQEVSVGEQSWTVNSFEKEVAVASLCHIDQSVINAHWGKFLYSP